MRSYHSSPMPPFVAASGCWDLNLLPTLYNWGICQGISAVTNRYSDFSWQGRFRSAQPRLDDVSNDNSGKNTSTISPDIYFSPLILGHHDL